MTRKLYAPLIEPAICRYCGQPANATGAVILGFEEGTGERLAYHRSCAFGPGAPAADTPVLFAGPTDAEKRRAARDAERRRRRWGQPVFSKRNAT